MAGQATFPDLGNFSEVLAVIVPIVEKNVSQTSTNNGTGDYVHEAFVQPFFGCILCQKHPPDDKEAQ